LARDSLFALAKNPRGVTPSPKDIGILKRWAKFFCVAKDKKQEFFHLAAIARNELPPDMASDERALAALPAFFRAVRGSELEGDKLKEFINDIRSLHSPTRGPREEGQGRCLEQGRSVPTGSPCRHSSTCRWTFFRLPS